MRGLLVPAEDYQQIFRTIYSVFEHEKLDLKASCMGYNIIGAMLLNDFYGIDARPFAGIAAYCISEEPKAVLMFASEFEGSLRPTDGGFHCWVETKDWLIDFTAPLFPLIVAGKNLPDPGPKMLQKEVALLKDSPQALTLKGDAFACPDEAFTKAALTGFAHRPFHHDLINVCRSWYAKPGSPMRKHIRIINQRGDAKVVELSNFQVVGCW